MSNHKILLMSIIILLIGSSTAQVFAEPQIEVSNGVFNDEENLWDVNVTGSGFYPDYEIRVALYHQDMGGMEANNLYTDQNGDFDTNLEMHYGYLESGNYTVEIRELKIYEFEKYIEFGNFSENSIEWTISPTTTTEGQETIFEINGVVNFEPVYRNEITFGILDSNYDYTRYFIDEFVEIDTDGSFRIIDLVESPPIGEHRVIAIYDGLIRYGNYTVIPAEIVPPKVPDTEPVVTEYITLSIDKSTHYIDDTITLTGNLDIFDSQQSMNVQYFTYHNSNTIQYQDGLMDDNGDFEILIPTDNLTGTGFGTITVSIQNNDASIDFHYTDTPDYSTPTLYDMIMTNMYTMSEYNFTMTDLINQNNLLTDLTNEQSKLIIDLQTEVNGLKDLVQGEAATSESSVPVIDNFTVLSNGDNSITLSWIIHGEPITAYNLIYRAEIGSWTTEGIPETDITSHTIINLENIEYEFKFSAENEFGESKKTLFSIMP